MGTVKNFFGRLTAQDKNPANAEGNEDVVAQQIISGLTDGVVGYDINFQINIFNLAAEKIFNLKAQDIIGQTVTPDSLKKEGWQVLTQVIFPSLAPRLNQISEAEEWPQISDLELSDPTLSLRTILIRLPSTINRPAGFLKIIKDRTREKEILRSKSEFISVAAHQLRTPITAINWAFENLIESIKNDSKLKEATSVAEQGHEVAQRALKIINDLLDVSKLEGGRFGFQFIETNLNYFTQTVVEGLKIIADYYKIKTYFEPLPTPCSVFIDQQKLGLAISNLIDNAIRYNNKNGEVRIAIQKENDGKFVNLIIKDTGVGIPAAEMKKLFTKFYRGSNVIQLEPNGNGLGLYITKNIIEQHGGQIEIESLIGRGTTFTIKLPLDKNLVPQKEFFLEDY
ncbi:MAG: HAMP domain-containing sensor histidine kinase [bacterium]|nr:HAMP domain-containing sensor histidine kinase [bacterium]